MDYDTSQAKVESGVSIRLTRSETVALVELFASLREVEARNLKRLAHDLAKMAQRRGWLAGGQDDGVSRR